MVVRQKSTDKKLAAKKLSLRAPNNNIVAMTTIIS